MKKNNSGFSLVELIVVIAIMAILAGIAVPTYVKYIDEANNAKYINTLDEIKTAAIAAGIKDVGKEVVEIKITAGSADVTTGVVPASEIEVKFKAETGYVNVATTSEATCKSFFTLMGDISQVSDIKIGETGTTYAGGAVWTVDGGWAEPTSTTP